AQIIPMITVECEQLGGFIGDAFNLPLFQGGQLLTMILFMFMQDPILAAAAIALYPVQGYIIPKLQFKVNQLAKQRVRTVRQVADRVQESAAGIVEIQANDTVKLNLTDFAHVLGRIYDIRFEIYKRKFFAKFLNNFIGQLTPFFFYSLGGYLVIKGDLSFGALVAITVAQKDLASPWKELLDFYQIKENSRITYEQIVEQFQPSGMTDARLLIALRHIPLRPPEYDETLGRERERQLYEARRSGNIDFDLQADWIDYRSAGVSGPAELTERIAEILRRLDFEEDIYGLGLRGRLDPAAQPELAQRLLEARRALEQRLVAEGITNLVETYDPERYNSNATVAENLLFGTPIGPTFEL